MWAYESYRASPVPESEYSNPESEDSHPESECSASFMKASNIGANSTMPQFLQYSNYDSIAYSTLSPFNLDGPSAYSWDDEVLKSPPIVSRPQAQSPNSPKMAKR